jgi:hypothetical protein
MTWRYGTYYLDNPDTHVDFPEEWPDKKRQANVRSSGKTCRDADLCDEDDITTLRGSVSPSPKKIKQEPFRLARRKQNQ